MDDLLNRIRFSLDLSWNGLQDMVTGHFFQVVAVVAFIFFLWMMMAPTVRNRR